MMQVNISIMALVRRHIANRAVQMFLIVPPHELPDPFPGGNDAVKAFHRIFRTIFASAKKRFRVRVVIAYPGPAI